METGAAAGPGRDTLDRIGEPVVLGDSCRRSSAAGKPLNRNLSHAGLAVAPTAGVAGTAVSPGFSPVFGGRDFKRVLLRPVAGRERDAGYGETDHLPLTAAQAADGVAHEEDLFEI
jgi:hypothetical protein